MASLFQDLIEVIKKGFLQVFQQEAYRDIALQEENSKTLNIPSKIFVTVSVSLCSYYQLI